MREVPRPFLRAARLLLCAALLLAAVSLPARPPTTRAQEFEEPFDSERVRLATVQIMQVYTNPVGQTVMSCSGSGTLVSRDGLILTNAHVVLPLAGCRADRITVALTLRVGEPPVPKYYAAVVASNIGWDLAVLQITGTIDNLPVERTTLTLPFVELGDSESVRLDSTIHIAGYAPPASDAEADSISQVIAGTVSGFTAEARVGDRAWIKTRAALPGSLTGGGAYDSAGLLVGIPTVEPAASGISAVTSSDCRRIQDSNGDGRVDSQDLCIPVSGFINALRPARLARSLILAARLGVQARGQQDTAIGAGAPSAAPPVISRLCFAPGVDLAGMPTTIVSSVPAGITQLYLFFDYENMTDGMIYELRVLRDGLSDPTFSLAPATWSGGAHGLWYIGSTAQVWPNGNYEFILFVEGTRAASATITIGGAAQPSPEMSTILFGVLSPENELVSTGNVLPVSNTINAQFVYNNMSPGLIWRQVWYYDSVPISEGAGEWTGGVNGTLTINASSPPEQPLQPGRYRLELYIGDGLAATSDFVMAGGQVGISTEIFSNMVFATERGPNGAPAGAVGATQASGIPALNVTFDWRDVAPGTPFTWRWSVDDNLLFETTQDWRGASTGSGAWLALQTPTGLADGSYRLDLLVAGVVEASATARVGLGALPVAVFAVEQGVRLQGQVRDAETGAGILGASIIVLRPTFDVADFTWRMSEVYAMTSTDLNGQFLLARPLPDNEFYSVIVISDGYLPTSTDSLEVAAGRVNPIELNIALNRD